MGLFSGSPPRLCCGIHVSRRTHRIHMRLYCTVIHTQHAKNQLLENKCIVIHMNNSINCDDCCILSPSRGQQKENVNKINAITQVNVARFTLLPFQLFCERHYSFTTNETRSWRISLNCETFCAAYLCFDPSMCFFPPPYLIHVISFFLHFIVYFCILKRPILKHFDQAVCFTSYFVP